MVTWGCLRNYVLVFTKKREGFCGMKNRISSIYYLPHSFLHLFIRLFYMLFQKQKEDSTLILNHISKAPYFRSDRGVIEENVLYHCLWRLNMNSYNLRCDRVIEDLQKTSYADYNLGKLWYTSFYCIFVNNKVIAPGEICWKTIVGVWRTFSGFSDWQSQNGERVYHLTVNLLSWNQQSYWE